MTLRAPVKSPGAATRSLSSTVRCAAFTPTPLQYSFAFIVQEYFYKIHIRTHTSTYMQDAYPAPVAPCPDRSWHQISVATQEATLQLPMSPVQGQREEISHSASLLRNKGRLMPFVQKQGVMRKQVDLISPQSSLSGWLRSPASQLLMPLGSSVIRWRSKDGV